MARLGEHTVEQDRRAFLGVFGKAALIAPPVVTMLLSTSMASEAIAASTGGSGTINVGNGGDPPVQRTTITHQFQPVPPFRMPSRPHR